MSWAGDHDAVSFSTAWILSRHEHNAHSIAFCHVFTSQSYDGGIGLVPGAEVGCLHGHALDDHVTLLIYSLAGSWW